MKNIIFLLFSCSVFGQNHSFVAGKYAHNKTYDRISILTGEIMLWREMEKNT